MHLLRTLRSIGRVGLFLLSVILLSECEFTLYVEEYSTILWLGSLSALPVLSRCGVLSPMEMCFMSEVYLRLYSEFPVLDGTLCAYFDGLGMSDTLTKLGDGVYSCLVGNFRSCQLVSVGFVLAQKLVSVMG